MIVLLALIHTSTAADPAALRMLHGDAVAAVDVGTHGLSVAADVGPRVALTFEPGAWLGASVGAARVLAGEPEGWGIDGTVAVGAAALLATPGAALTATAGVRAGLRGERLQFTAGLVSPAALRLDWPVEVVFPVDVELTAGGALGGVWLGVRGFAGAGSVPGHPPTLRQGLSGWVRLAQF